MCWGLRNRLSKVISPKTGKTVMLAVDHGYFQGPTTGLRELKKAIDPLIPYADCLFITRGMLRNCVDPQTKSPIFLRVSGGPSILKDDLSDEHITTSMTEALRLNAVGVGMSIFVGGVNESRTVANLGKLVNEAEEYGMPVLAITAVGKEMARDERYLGLACRMAAEQGAHIVKTYYCDNFKEVVKACPVPIVIAGGKKIDEKDALQMARNAIDDGAVGVDMGRNIFQSENPVGMIKAINAVVHKNASVDDAFNIYEKEKK
ncbi:MAG: 3-hydroxy-5-phosphonooxypentane-2,4-dione thiolase [Candidatus Woesearchaeota archaeon]|jgi:putative autoinducer-2 (AI-2) aldolase|nr:3-hydroxy-5-phosphonooxypentane-2,4-dione thiolase [Candidatus Woesearchaeota archaeon]MDP7476687.1 3-hydroxy-5-phosphonooxypentane-2,4-dione thiolase [Candidatus Woesearchaeota archaeon]HJO01662.1 3-hydroxy-5-phosphonooxypentane-2,4-dione thiolase [Candidatus Woesearchaeota archaeon]|tara:strand:- start:581 stop:1363 length:783 start_codon:yes stop_codon:yes gene_type:complete